MGSINILSHSKLCSRIVFMPKSKKHVFPRSVEMSLMWMVSVKVSIMPLNSWHYALAYMPNDSVTDEIRTTTVYMIIKPHASIQVT